jgi:hypothetical protein
LTNAETGKLKKRERRPTLQKIEMKKGITININESRGSVGNSSKNLYSNKLEDLEAVDSFLDACDP